MEFGSETELVSAFCRLVESKNHERRFRWVAYHETSGWDLLLVQDETGIQVGIEAKLVLNAKVLHQALPYPGAREGIGPDYRAVLVPKVGKQLYIGRLAEMLGLTVITVTESRTGDNAQARYFPELPDEFGGISAMAGWSSWFPAERASVPAYLPDVVGGKASPLSLSNWKIGAIKLTIILDRRGYVTRNDMIHVATGQVQWTNAYDGFLTPDIAVGGYIRTSSTPDFRDQHPVAYAEIEADFCNWAPEDLRP